MQSGISASQELQNAFNSFVSSTSQRALLAGIENETLIPVETIPLSSTFEADLTQLQEHLLPTKANYILLKLDTDNAADGFVAVTFVPNAAPVRQKMLFASTRLTLVRELGIERFRETIFATEKEELTAEGWKKHVAHTDLQAPLTEEEQGLAGVKEAEAQESQGTGGRRGHVTSKMDVKTGDGVVEALQELMQEKGTLVQLKYELPDETLLLDTSSKSVQPSDLATSIPSSEPRYSFYHHPTAGSADQPTILFIYTCPSGSKIKERMVYSTGKSWCRTVAERDAGVTVARSLEATEPSELIEELEREFADKKEESKGFARPKRPGRR
ncbi:actin monomer binding protein-like protein [Polychaeton citri CBS 116435]|uniref:Actin monomer binding protein-like protein n=1 Tax=Polychaeton citri CBS 116435 TaxID=1314669 RepID=A0A9P4Q4L9_9PEZI|nr:actin monomer binding protein-like protein [Polychaeton citri CBS 116435]